MRYLNEQQCNQDDEREMRSENQQKRNEDEREVKTVDYQLIISITDIHCEIRHKRINRRRKCRILWN